MNEMIPPPAATPRQVEKFKRLVLPLIATLLRTAYALTRHEHEAEDLVQEAMIKALRAIDSFEEGTNAKAWLMTILRRTHIDRGRSSASEAGTVSIEQSEWVIESRPEDAAGQYDQEWENPDELLERFSDQQVIDALKSLPEDIRWTLLLVDVQQMDHADAAAVLGVPVGTIKSRTHRGRGMLRDHLFKLRRPTGGSR